MTNEFWISQPPSDFSFTGSVLPTPLRPPGADTINQACSLLAQAREEIQLSTGQSRQQMDRFLTNRECAEHSPCCNEMLQDIVEILLHTDLAHPNSVEESISVCTLVLPQTRFLAAYHGVSTMSPRLARYMARRSDGLPGGLQDDGNRNVVPNESQQNKNEQEIAQGLRLFYEIESYQIELIFLLEAFSYICMRHYERARLILTRVVESAPAFAQETRLKHFLDLMAFAPLKPHLVFQFFQNMANMLISRSSTVGFSEAATSDTRAFGAADKLIFGAIVGMYGIGQNSISPDAWTALYAGLSGGLSQLHSRSLGGTNHVERI